MRCTTEGVDENWTTTWTAMKDGRKVNVAFADGPKNVGKTLKKGPLRAEGVFLLDRVWTREMQSKRYAAIDANSTIPGTSMSRWYWGEGDSAGVLLVRFERRGQGHNHDTVCTPQKELELAISGGGVGTSEDSDGPLQVSGAGVTGGFLTLKGDGFAPGSAVEAGLDTTGAAIATGVADSSGRASVDVWVPAGLTGSQTLVLAGFDTSGASRGLTQGYDADAKNVSSALQGDSPTWFDDSDSGGAGRVLFLLALLVAVVGGVGVQRTRPLKITGAHSRRH